MKTIVILGSTGSIGKSLLKIINKDKKSFNIKLLTAHKNYKQLLRQAKLFKVKKVILTDKKTYNLKKENFTKNNISVFNNFSELGKILTNKVDYVMSAIVGLDGLEPTLKLIKYTKNIAIANKESIICGWNLINKSLKINKTNFIPVDSEHFSIWYGLNKKFKTTNVKRIYLTASGGPLLNISNKKLNKIKLSQVLKHPNWNMGKKISVDSSTMMNKIFEVIEAKKIFNIKYNQLSILIHPDSYIHAIVEFKNRMISIIAHDTTMDIPIYNTLFDDNKSYILNKSYSLDLNKLNSLSLKNVQLKKFPVVKILNLLPSKSSLFETALVAANDELVNLYLKNKIRYNDISSLLIKEISKKYIVIMKKKSPTKVSSILNVTNLVRSRINQQIHIK
jgi:1-deoxy-D-xylulose-5-phosphate reductoisomerase